MIHLQTISKIKPLTSGHSIATSRALAVPVWLDKFELLKLEDTDKVKPTSCKFNLFTSRLIALSRKGLTSSVQEKMNATWRKVWFYFISEKLLNRYLF